MRYQVEEYYREYMLLIAMFKIFYDAGITGTYQFYQDNVINDMEYYYQYIIDAMDEAAPIVYDDELSLYKKYGLDADYDRIYGYSCKEMQEYYKIARKLYRIEGCKGSENPYLVEIQRKIENMRYFYSYCFDYDIRNKRKAARLEILLFCEFDAYIPLNIWIVRTMELFREELPKIKQKYREARRLKRSKPKKGGAIIAG